MTFKFSFYRAHPRVSFDNLDPKGKPYPSMTKQEFKDECDINNIIKAYSQTGMLNHVAANAADGRYEDLPDNHELQDAILLVAAAEASFMSLPAKIRDRFGNDPVRFVEFTSNPDNLSEMHTLGLLRPDYVPPGTGGDGGAPPVGGSEATVAQTPPK
ncbi:internal scaffolding protein [robinz microvirus RP_82]|nr:internal scaffolding protein [robinz microvirus RP_82]